MFEVNTTWIRSNASLSIAHFNNGRNDGVVHAQVGVLSFLRVAPCLV